MTRRIAAITGGAGALGSVLAETLVARGYKVALLDRGAASERLATLVKELGPESALAHASEFATSADWKAALDAIRAAFGGLPSEAALIAGGWGGGRPLHEAEDDAVYEHMMKANTDSAYRALRALLPAMVQGRSGSVVVVGSRAVLRPWTSTGSAAYAASKAATVVLAQTVAEEVLEHGVRINAILPSTLDTRANRKAMPDADPSRWVGLESAAAVIAFLLSDEARDVSGAAIPLYGRS
jgi:NAD(P)-dependent dehydrogenase (short-subunit alcohol dehydrogenase family)